MAEQFAVTGAAGFLGGHIARHLCRMGRVVGVDRMPASPDSPQVESLQLDICSPLPQSDIAPGATVIHAAASMNAGDVGELWNVNVNGTRNVLEWAVKMKASHLVFTSSGGVYGYAKDRYRRETDELNPIGYYGYTKSLGESLCHMHSGLYGLDITILRLYFPYGPGQKRGIFPLIHRSVLEGRPLAIKPRGSPRMNPVHVDDIAAAVDLAIHNHAGVSTYNLSGDDAVSFLDVVQLFEQQLQRKALVSFTSVDEGDLLGDNSLIKERLAWQPRRHVGELLGIQFQDIGG
jgi:nucleoside-diphosphate-sugar epimerase